MVPAKNLWNPRIHKTKQIRIIDTNRNVFNGPISTNSCIYQNPRKILQDIKNSKHNINQRYCKCAMGMMSDFRTPLTPRTQHRQEHSSRKPSNKYANYWLRAKKWVYLGNLTLKLLIMSSKRRDGVNGGAHVWLARKHSQWWKKC